MRHARLSTIFLLSAALLLSGCATNGKPASQRHDPEPTESSPTRITPPPPAPAAYGISHVKTIGFLRAFGSKDCADDRSCATDPCTEGCTEGCSSVPQCGLFGCLHGKNLTKLFGHCKSDDASYFGSKICCLKSLPAWWFNDRSAFTGYCKNDVCICDAFGERPVYRSQYNNGCANTRLEYGGHQNDRYPCLAKPLEDPFLDQIQEQEIKPEQPQAPPSPVVPPVPPAPPTVPARQALSPLPYTGVASGKPADSYFPKKFGRQRTIVEPPRWQERHTTRSAETYHSVTQETTSPIESTPALPASLQMMIQPRQYFGR